MAKRLIDIAPYENMADATVCQIQVYRNGNGCCDVMNFKTEAIRTVDAVEVCYCKDCKYWSQDGNGYMDDEYHCGNAYGIEGYPEEHDFCSRGERRCE